MLKGPTAGLPLTGTYSCEAPVLPTLSFAVTLQWFSLSHSFPLTIVNSFRTQITTLCLGEASHCSQIPQSCTTIDTQWSFESFQPIPSGFWLKSPLLYLLFDVHVPHENIPCFSSQPGDQLSQFACNLEGPRFMGLSM